MTARQQAIRQAIKPDRMLTITQAAAVLCVSRSTIYDWIHAGILGAAGRDHPLRVPVVALEIYVVAELADWRRRNGWIDAKADELLHDLHARIGGLPSSARRKRPRQIVKGLR